MARATPEARPTHHDCAPRIARAQLPAPHLGSHRLSGLERRTIERVYATLLARGGQDGAPLSPSTVQGAHATLHRALEDARLDGLLDENPAAHAQPPRRDVNAAEIDDQLQVWTLAQVQHFLHRIEDHPLRSLWHLALDTGARRGELLGLSWSDLDLPSETMTIRRSLSVVGGVPRWLGTKTSATRRLSLGPSVVDGLQQHQAQQEQEPLFAGDVWNNERELVFTNQTGRYLHPSWVSSEFQRLVGLIDVPRIRFHDLRHTHASVMFDLGVPVKVISDRLGHASSRTTMDLYVHLMPATDQKAAAVFQELLEEGGTSQD